MKNIIIVCSLGIGFFSSCSSFLDKKSDIHLAVPNKLEHATLLLNDYTELNSGYPIFGDLGTDDFYLTSENWDAANSVDQRNAYIWADEPYIDAAQWQRPYKTIYIANQVLEILEKVHKEEDVLEYRRNLGTAHFYRAFVFAQLTELHCPAYDKSTAGSELGIPLRLKAGIDALSVRATLKETYRQIVNDYKAAIVNLPLVEPVIGRPSKASAFAGLSRTYLNMGDFRNAYLYADSCLQINPSLLDYNTLNASDDLPIPRFNVEVLFPAQSVVAGLMDQNTALVDDDLYDSYTINDLRKSVFFKANGTPVNTFRFKGSYDKSLGALFIGITTSEVYLTKAESACRIAEIDEALSAINTLLKSRWNKAVAYTPITESDPENLLFIILKERRKELLFRGRRWSDLKRLNLDERFKKTLVRSIGNDTYTLEPNSPKYAFRIPQSVIDQTGMPQNKR
ncbi:RagB/SusD family nutrient uptake outer membrane protein [Sphingobacterium faecale]|uniref:RagB/SusD family nutrient uptake outer membrane protein n=1 Tax=Sphingobacterium faecale TaxID=2803775 RepID=A0ABS1QYM6_9SPHI|nr:RagB/SusD family nutrient uptake outer membrane protein [Sphingobacterium faecale]MBL1407540.1 RagB/SusD family nutrient uptake outer membrane protein [Sphingobacterium faecale]